jgi:histidinol phosphatase-like PHP family hydrolase
MSLPWQWHDLHVHTRPHSPDAHWRATLKAMLKKAAGNGVQTIGLANHYFPDTNFEIFRKLRYEAAQKTPGGMTVLVGAECCVLDTGGSLIVSEAEAGQLDFILAGPHHFKQRWVDQPPTGSAADFIAHQHRMLLNAAKHPLVNGLAHPWVINIQHAERRWGFTPAQFLTAWQPDHWQALAKVAQAHDTAVEIGMGIHLMAQHQGPEFWQKYGTGMQILKAGGVKFYVGSDAHHLHVIARLDWLIPTLETLGFTPDDVISPLDWLRQR